MFQGLVAAEHGLGVHKVRDDEETRVLSYSRLNEPGATTTLFYSDTETQDERQARPRVDYCN